jgi:response regulator RpfG family c-di-GMP phosphodiesterase
MSAAGTINVLYVDDEVFNLNAFKASFRRLFNVHVAQSAVEGRKILETEDINIILTDQRMPVTTGIDFLKSIIPDFPEPVRILLTGYADSNAVAEAIQNGEVYQCIQKPWVQDELQHDIEKAFDLYNTTKEPKN